MFIMVDGMDGSGKSTVVKTWKEQLAASGNAIFDLVEYQKQRTQLPEPHELNAYDFIISGEPTYAGVGKVIREELIKKGTSYPPLAIAESYSLDRLILYTHTLIPALASGKCVIQDRGISSSLAYQPLMTKALTAGALSRLPGNALALKNAPDHLVIVTADPAIALKRLSARLDKQDNTIFERAAFLKKLARTFASKGYASLFTRRGTKVHYLRGDVEIGIMKTAAKELLTKILAPHKKTI